MKKTKSAKIGADYWREMYIDALIQAAGIASILRDKDAAYVLQKLANEAMKPPKKKKSD